MCPCLKGPDQKCHGVAYEPRSITSFTPQRINNIWHSAKRFPLGGILCFPHTHRNLCVYTHTPECVTWHHFQFVKQYLVYICFEDKVLDRFRHDDDNAGTGFEKTLESSGKISQSQKQNVLTCVVRSLSAASHLSHPSPERPHQETRTEAWTVCGSLNSNLSKPQTSSLHRLTSVHNNPSYSRAWNRSHGHTYCGFRPIRGGKGVASTRDRWSQRVMRQAQVRYYTCKYTNRWFLFCFRVYKHSGGFPTQLKCLLGISILVRVKVYAVPVGNTTSDGTNVSPHMDVISYVQRVLHDPPPFPATLNRIRSK